MRRGLKITLIATVATLAGACASTQPVVESAPAPAERPAEKPVFEEAAPVEAVPVTPFVQAPVQVGPIAGSTADFVNSAGDRVYFAYNQYNLDANSRASLKDQAEWLSRYPNVIAIIAGNADERGTREYNLALGARRAESVKDYLVSQGVNPDRLTTVSYGKERPISDGSDERSWALNRNGHTTIVSGTTS